VYAVVPIGVGSIKCVAKENHIELNYNILVYCLFDSTGVTRKGFVSKWKTRNIVGIHDVKGIGTGTNP